MSALIMKVFSRKSRDDRGDISGTHGRVLKKWEYSKDIKESLSHKQLQIPICLCVCLWCFPMEYAAIYGHFNGKLVVKHGIVELSFNVQDKTISGMVRSIIGILKV